MARIPENPLPATLTRTTDGHVIPMPQPDTLHLHQDQVVHHHYAQAIPTTGAQIGVELAKALGKIGTGIGVTAAGMTGLYIGGQVIAMDMLAIGGASIGIAYGARTVTKAIGSGKPPEKPKRRWFR